MLMIKKMNLLMNRMTLFLDVNILSITQDHLRTSVVLNHTSQRAKVINLHAQQKWLIVSDMMQFWTQHNFRHNTV